MRAKLEKLWTVIAVVACLCALSGCQAHRQTQTSVEAPRAYQGADLPPKQISFSEALGAIRVYKDRGNTVIVQHIADGVEFGKYAVPCYSSSFPAMDVNGGLMIGGGITLTPATGLSLWLLPGGEGSFTIEPAASPTFVFIDTGELAAVYDYRKSQPDGAANWRQPIRSDINRPPAAAASGR
jgi:hypothetical protein